MNLKFSFRSAFVIFLPLCWWLKETPSRLSHMKFTCVQCCFLSYLM